MTFLKKIEISFRINVWNHNFGLNANNKSDNTQVTVSID